MGVRVTIDKTWGRWDIIYSIQPIFRQKNGEIVRGAVHGADRGFELVSQAKPGYVVGRVEVSKGGMLDGMRVAFSCAIATGNWIPRIRIAAVGWAQIGIRARGTFGRRQISDRHSWTLGRLA